MFDINNLLRENIKKLVPYSSARDEFKGSAEIFLDANENSYGSPLEQNFNRYPDPMQMEVKKKISGIKGLLPESIFLGNGSDEVIDLLFRAFCNPGIDNVIICPPTYGMYEVSANINDVYAKKIPLTEDFQLDIEAISEVVDERTKIIFLCSPNNPTGNSLNREDVEMILNNFEGIVVIDEAYINYSRQKSFIAELTEYPNLLVMQTLSKAWGLAGLRIGMAFASPEIIAVLSKIKPPYNVSEATQRLAIEALGNIEKVNAWIKETVSEREKLVRELGQLECVKKIYPSDANFLLVKVDDPKKRYDQLMNSGIIVRDRSKVTLCEGCLRITVGTPEENVRLIEEMRRGVG
ncbi:MAG TPA: histidinol-phosphate transaminase [Bacteroidia bacterium]|jgi:histidinol-phosphate aminotransferase|nr:histidinol-phosphate transaminase [Bacteroidia bacterium]